MALVKLLHKGGKEAGTETVASEVATRATPVLVRAFGNNQIKANNVVAVSTTDAAVAASSTTDAASAATSAAGGNTGTGGNAGTGNQGNAGAGNGGGNADATCLAAGALQTGSASAGTPNVAAGQSDSAT